MFKEWISKFDNWYQKTRLAKWYKKESEYVRENHELTVISIKLANRLLLSYGKISRLFGFIVFFGALIFFLLYLSSNQWSINLENIVDLFLFLSFILIFTYSFVLAMIYWGSINLYKFKFWRGAKFIFLDSGNAIFISAVLAWLFYSSSGYKFPSFLLTYIIIFISLYFVVLLFRTYFSYESIEFSTHLRYTKNCLNDYKNYKNDSSTLSNIKIKTYASVILTEEKIEKHIKSNHRSKYMLGWSKVDNLEILAAQVFWLNPKDTWNTKKISGLLNEGIKNKVAFSKDAEEFVSFMDKIKTFCNQEFELNELKDAIKKIPKKGFLLTIPPIVIAIFNVIIYLLENYSSL